MGVGSVWWRIGIDARHYKSMLSCTHLTRRYYQYGFVGAHSERNVDAG